MSHGMNIKSISALYHETHAVSHARTRLKGDSQVNHALDCRISRESEWTRKQSTTVKAQETLDLVEDLNTVCGVRPGFAKKLRMCFRSAQTTVSDYWVLSGYWGVYPTFLAGNQLYER